MKKRTLFFAAFAAAFLMLICSCSRKQAPSRAELTVESEPSGASVFLLGKDRGPTPFRCRIQPGTYDIRLTKDGCAPVWIPVTLALGEKKLVSGKLPPLTAGVMLTSVPSGAVVTFQGKTMGSTPLILRDLPFGKYSAELKSPGFSPKMAEWSVSSARPVEVRTLLSSSIGTLQITSEPSGAAVYLNNAHAGRTPYKKTMPQGEYSLSIRLNGYENMQEKISVTRGRLTKRNYPLSPLPSALSITTNPSGAMVTVNGKDHGPSPVTLTGIPAGKYVVTASCKNCDPESASVDLAPGQKYPMKLDLKSSVGSVEVVTVPGGVKIYLDNKFIGETRPDPLSEGISQLFRISGIQPGTHELKFFHKLAKPQQVRKMVRVDKGAATRLKNVEMWIVNAVITLKNNTKHRGRLVAELADGEILFEPEPRIKISYKKDEIREIQRIRGEE